MRELETIDSGDLQGGDPQDSRALARARLRAFRFPKGKSGNPGGISKYYHECRRLAKQASPRMMKTLIELAENPAVDERVRSVCAMAVLDRAGVKPIDFDPNEETDSHPRFNPRDYSVAELDLIEAALKLMLRPKAVEAGADENSLRGPGGRDRPNRSAI